MEVHHHPDLHHKQKRFKEYILEGVMIFVAVTLGFFAETIRERISENKIARELAENLYKEVYDDSIAIQNEIAFRYTLDNQCNYFIDYVRDSSLTDLPDEFFNSFDTIFFQVAHFEPNDAVLSQLRNSGDLRYFKNSKLQTDVGELGVVISKVKIRNAQDFDFVQFTLKPFALKYSDIRRVETQSQREFNKRVKRRILNIDQFNRQEAVNLVSFYAMVVVGTRDGEYKDYVGKNHELLAALRR